VLSRPEHPDLYILLAAFNGAAFIEEQIASIRRQTYRDWVLLVRDDGSTDDTAAILDRLQAEDPRIRICEDEHENLGVVGNFGGLMQMAFEAGSRWVCCSDQDDIWREDKIEILLNKMRKLEEAHPDQPVLIHSDLEVVDEALQLICASFMKYTGIRHEKDAPLAVLLAQNFVTGCTIMANQPLLNQALPVPNCVMMYDWWLALCAAVFGVIGYIEAPLVKYRQHSGNLIGAQSFSFRSLVRRGKRSLKYLKQSAKQARSLFAHIEKNTPNHPDLRMIQMYAEAIEKGGLVSALRLMRMGIRKQSMLRRILFPLQITLVRMYRYE